MRKREYEEAIEEIHKTHFSTRDEYYEFIESKGLCLSRVKRKPYHVISIVPQRYLIPRKQ